MNTKLVYSREDGITFAYRFDDANQRIVYNSARCGKRDQFAKAVGRRIATERLSLDRPNHPNSSVRYDTIGGDRYNLIANYLRNRGVNY